MKIMIEIDDSLDQPEVTIRAMQIDEDILEIQRRLQQIGKKMAVYKQTTEFFITISDILFFEMDDTKVYAHDGKGIYEVKQKLYQLEEMLPSYFCRVSKSAILNIRQVYAVERSFSGASTVRFYNSQEYVHVSRHYDRLLKDRLQEWR